MLVLWVEKEGIGRERKKEKRKKEGWNFGLMDLEDCHFAKEK